MDLLWYHKIDIESYYVFEMDWHWVLFMSLKWIDIESYLCLWNGMTLSLIMSYYVFELDWHWVLLCLWNGLTLCLTMYSLRKDRSTLSIYLLFIGLSQKPLPSLLVNKLLVLFFWHPKQFQYTTKMIFIYNQNEIHTQPKWDSYTTKMRFKNWFIFNQDEIHIQPKWFTLSHIQPKWFTLSHLQPKWFTLSHLQPKWDSYTTKMIYIESYTTIAKWLHVVICPKSFVPILPWFSDCWSRGAASTPSINGRGLSSMWMPSPLLWSTNIVVSPTRRPLHPVVGMPPDTCLLG